MILEALRNISITVSLIILIPLTLFYGFDLFYPKPVKQENTEQKKAWQELDAIQKERDKALYEHYKQQNKKGIPIKSLTNTTVETLEKQIEAKKTDINSTQTTLDKAFEEALNHHLKIFSIISAILGIFLIIAGLLFPAGTIGSGLLMGGSIIIAWGSLGLFQSHTHQKLSPFFGLAAICVIIGLGYFLCIRKRKQVS